jgi:NIMA (never in mitosis gene a)-related kinase
LVALKEVHTLRIVHADIKPSNILIKSGYQTVDVRLSDFGVSRKIPRGTGLIHEQLGTLHYCSPEIITEQGFNEKTDVWALGCVLYELLTFRKVFSAELSESKIREAILRNNIPHLPHTVD